MKKVLLSAAVLLGVISICISNSATSNAQVAAGNHSFIIKDTVPSDTTMTKDSTFKL